MKMHVTAAVPIILTHEIGLVRSFYTEKLGFEITFDNDDYLGLKAPGGGAEISFMRPGDCSEMRAYEGSGLCLGLLVESADEAHAFMVERGVQIVAPLTDNPWGDRSTVAIDPIGLSLYVYHPIEPTAEFKKFHKS